LQGNTNKLPVKQLKTDISHLQPASIKRLNSIVLSAQIAGFVIQGNIEKLSVKQLEAYKADMWLLAPPCQPYTRRGLQKDADDWRATSFMTLLLKLPQMQVTKKRILMLKNTVYCLEIQSIAWKHSLLHENTIYCSHGNADGAPSILFLHMCHAMKARRLGAVHAGNAASKTLKAHSLPWQPYIPVSQQTDQTSCQKAAFALHAARLLFPSRHDYTKQASDLTTAALCMLHIIDTDKAPCRLFVASHL
jgi:hypothetical protein